MHALFVSGLSHRLTRSTRYCNNNYRRWNCSMWELKNAL